MRAINFCSPANRQAAADTCPEEEAQALEPRTTTFDSSLLTRPKMHRSIIVAHLMLGPCYAFKSICDTRCAVFRSQQLPARAAAASRTVQRHHHHCRRTRRLTYPFYFDAPLQQPNALRMSKDGEGDKNESDGGDAKGVLFPPGLVFLCTVLLPYNNPVWVGAVFLTALAAYNVYMRKNE